MTDTTPHRATAEQWASLENSDCTFAYEACILELRTKVEELENKQDTQRVGMLDVYQHLDRLKTQHESNWSRIVKLEEGATCPHIVSSDEGTSYCGLAEQQAAATPPEPAPAGSLVEGVVEAMKRAEASWPGAARAAIRAVAEWLDTKGQHGCSLWLREEVER